MQTMNFYDYLYDESTDGYIQILKLNDDTDGARVLNYKLKVLG